MATKTVINSNGTTLPQTRGISITIDDQAQQQQTHQLDCISSATSKIAISPNISTAYTAQCNYNNNNNNNGNSNKLDTNLTTTTTTRYSTTFIDINRNEDDDQNKRTGLTRSKQHIVEKESMTMSTFPQQRQLLEPMTLRQDHVNSTGTPSSLSAPAPLSERRKTKVNEEVVKQKAKATTNGLGKVVATSNVGDNHDNDDDVDVDDDQCISVSHVVNNFIGNGTDGIGICITPEYHNENSTESTKLTQKKSNDDNDVLTTTTMVIACGEQKNFNANDHHDHRVHHKDANDNNNDVVESCLGDGGRSGSGEYFSNISVGSGGTSSSLTVAAAAAALNSPFWSQLENNNAAAHSSSKSFEIELDPDCASALTETQADADELTNSLVVKIKISPTNEQNGVQDNSHKVEESNSSVCENPLKIKNKSQTNLNSENKKSLTKVTVVKLNEELEEASPLQLKLKIIEDKMVQKPCAMTQNSQSNANANTNGNTTVTELNVPPNQSSPSSSSSYLYYMMSSGQFSPCDTLDSGTGSDLECNVVSNSPPPKMPSNSVAGKNGSNSAPPKLELHLKTTKIRVNTGTGNSNGVGVASKEKTLKADASTTNEHLRAGSLTDSEESESSLSCDSLNSSEFLRHNSNSPPSATVVATPTPTKSNGSFLPDSLLRDIRDRKYPTNDFVSKYVVNNNSPTIYECVVEPKCNNASPTPSLSPPPPPPALNFAAVQEAVAHAKYVRERNNSNLFSKRASLPHKTFVLNSHDGSFVDTKMNSMPRKYEADKYYNFHVNEHENFRSFGNGSIGNGADLSDNGDGCSESGSWTDYECKSMPNDDAFAGYKDIRCSSAASTIRSSKGTVRGVKNRVRNGIATFLQLQQPNVKNYKEKDLGKVVLYTTSMGIIRETYAKCSNVKQILRTLLVKFEERDVFMSVEYQQEIKERMHSEAIKVPQLFVEGQHIGDAETVERLNESGELRQLLKPYKSIATTYTCQTCGGYRLLPCPSCNGSKKSVHRNHFTAEFVALKCMNCDEVGLVKCHNC